MYYSSPGDLWGALTNVIGQGAGWAGDTASQFGNWASQPNNALGLLAGVGTGLGAAGQIMGGMQAADRSRELSRLSRQPFAQPTLDVNQFYTPMSEAARQALERQFKAEEAAMGRPMDSAYIRGATAENLAKTETGRLAEAQRNALQKYQTDAGMGQNQRYLQLQALGQRPGMPAFGDVSSLGSYLRWRASQNARERGNQPSPGAAAGGTMPGGIPPNNYYGTAPNAAVTSNLYPDEMSGFYQTPYGEGENY